MATENNRYYEERNTKPPRQTTLDSKDSWDDDHIPKTTDASLSSPLDSEASLENNSGKKRSISDKPPRALTIPYVRKSDTIPEDKKGSRTDASLSQKDRLAQLQKKYEEYSREAKHHQSTLYNLKRMDAGQYPSVEESGSSVKESGSSVEENSSSIEESESDPRVDGRNDHSRSVTIIQPQSGIISSVGRKIPFSLERIPPIIWVIFMLVELIFLWNIFKLPEAQYDRHIYKVAKILYVEPSKTVLGSVLDQAFAWLEWPNDWSTYDMPS
jgi:hypothetical protein